MNERVLDPRDNNFEQERAYAETREKSADRLTGSDVVEMSKPWIKALASISGVKGLYDLPVYLTERYQLRGYDIGGISFKEGGLSKSTSDLLSELSALHSNAEGKKENSIMTRGEMFSRLDELENSGQTEDEEYRVLQEQLDSEHPTAVREAINEINKKLSFTKEGEIKKSETRNEMARILREHRKKEVVDRSAVKEDITNLLDYYSEQKVDGVTAAKEGLRSVMVLGSQAYIISAFSSLALDGVDFVKKTGITAHKEGLVFDEGLLALKFGEAVKNNWQKLKGTDVENKSLGKKWIDRAGAAAKFTRIGALTASLGFNPDAIGEDLEKLSDFSIENMPSGFTGNLEMLGNRIKSIGSFVGSFFSLGPVYANGSTVPEVNGENLKTATEEIQPVNEEIPKAQNEPPTIPEDVLKKAFSVEAEEKPDPTIQTENTVNTDDDKKQVFFGSERNKQYTNQMTNVETANNDTVPVYFGSQQQEQLAEEMEDMNTTKGKFDVPLDEEVMSPDTEVALPDTPEAIKSDIKFNNQEVYQSEFEKAGEQPESSPYSGGTSAETVGTPVDEKINALVKEIKQTPGYKVMPGDNVWNIIEKKLEAHDLFHKLKDGQRTHLIDELKDKVTAMSKEELRDFGIKSGDPNLIKEGEILNFSKIMSEDSLEKAVTHAENLSATQIEQIENYVPQKSGATIETAGRTASGTTASDHHTINVEFGSEQHEQLAEQVEGLDTTNGKFDNMANLQTAEFKADRIITKDIHELYGSNGIFGIGSTKGVNSITWIDLRDRPALELMAKDKFPTVDIYNNPIDTTFGYNSEYQVEKMQRYVANLIKESGLKPMKSETVNNFIHRAAEAIVKNR